MTRIQINIFISATRLYRVYATIDLDVQIIIFGELWKKLCALGPTALDLESNSA